MKKVFFVMVLFLFVSNGIHTANYAAQVNTKESVRESEIEELVKKYYYYELPAYTGFHELLVVLDEYSMIYPKPLQNKIGIGIQLIRSQELLYVNQVIEGSPAELAGVKIGDQLTKLNENSLEGLSLSEVAILFQETQKQQSLKLTVIRGKEEFVLEVSEKYELDFEDQEIRSLKLNEDWIYIRIAEFQQGCAQEFIDISYESAKKGITNMIIDLRGNQGGLLTEVVEICKQIIPMGDIVTIREKKSDAYETTTYQSSLEQAPFQLMVLIDEESASASEILAAAVTESEVGYVIGATSFGKSSVQKLFKLSDGAYFKLTVGEYLTREGKSIQNSGVQPDFEVEAPDFIQSDLQKYSVGSYGAEVFKIEGALQYFGYLNTEADEFYDEATKEAVKQFQKDTSLYSYGVCDYTTQRLLNQKILEIYEKVRKG